MLSSSCGITDCIDAHWCRFTGNVRKGAGDRSELIMKMLKLGLSLSCAQEANDVSNAMQSIVAHMPRDVCYFVRCCAMDRRNLSKATLQVISMRKWTS
uniref:Ovule protein n=1 Tax=Parascaris univalens TaxID=6257 RepID=A0A915ADN8_PARUN